MNSLPFFFSVFTLCIPFWVVGAVARRQVLPGVPVSSAVIISPLLAALLLVYRDKRIAGVTELLKRAFDYRRIRAKGWYAPILLLMPAVAVLSFGWLRWTGLAVPARPISVLPALGLFVGLFFAALGEELGWSGYALDRLQARSSALQASLLLGAVWAAWHLVLLVQAGRSPDYVVWQSLTYLLERVLFVWLYKNTGKSVFATAVFHAILNVSWQLFPIKGSFYDPRVTGLIVLVAAVIVTVGWGPQTLARYRFVQPKEKRSKP